MVTFGKYCTFYYFFNMITIRLAQKTDIHCLLQLIKELAEYEQSLHEVTATEKTMIDAWNSFKVYIAENENFKTVGMALFFPYYSTWKGTCLYLEDIVVTKSYRRKGIGKLLFNAVVEEAKNSNANRLMWQVLDWNTPAIEFYKKLNTEFSNEWLNCKLTKEQLEEY